MSYKPLVNVESGLSKQIKGWIENGKAEDPSKRLLYGGGCYGGYVHLKTTNGEVITYWIHNK